MSTYYVDPAASDADDGSSWTDAWETFQQALDGTSAGDIVYCRGTEVLGSEAGTAASGSLTNGNIHFIGCNASGTARAGWFTLDATTEADSLWIAHNFLTFENIIFANGSNSGVKLTATCNNLVFRQCRFEDSGGDGFSGNSYDLLDSIFVQCYFNGNGDDGCEVDGQAVHFRYCQFKDNTDAGLYLISGLQAGADAFGCLFHGNGGHGVEAEANVSLCNCVIDGNGADGVHIVNSISGVLITGCRITNNTDDGIESAWANCDSIIEDWNGFYGNGGDDLVAVDAGTNSVVMAGDGYTNQASDVFNLTGAAEARDLAIPLDVLV